MAQISTLGILLSKSFPELYKRNDARAWLAGSLTTFCSVFFSRSVAFYSLFCVLFVFSSLYRFSVVDF